MFRSYRDTFRPPKEPEKKCTLLEYNCDMCSRGGWFTETDLEIHRKSNHSTQLKKIRQEYMQDFCTVCMRLQQSAEGLIAHIKEKHLLSSPDAQRVERMLYICGECANVFFNKDMLTLHIKYTHTPKNKRAKQFFTCPKCSKTIRLTSMWFHMQHHDIPSPSVCEICITQFETQTELSEHIKTHQPYYKCEQTGFHTNVKEQFDSHLKAFKLRSFNVDEHLEADTDGKLKIFKRELPPSPFKYNVHSVTKGLVMPDTLDICIICREICTSREEMTLHALRDHFNLPEKVGNRCTCGEEFEFQILLKQHVFDMKGEQSHEHKPVESALLTAQKKARMGECTSSTYIVKKETASGSGNKKVKLDLTSMSEVSFSSS